MPLQRSDLTPLSDAFISDAGYEEATQTLYLRFNHAGMYTYDGVPPEVRDQIMTAGRASYKRFIEIVFNKFPGRRVSRD